MMAPITAKQSLRKHYGSDDFCQQTLTPEEYLSQWMPKLYGVRPSERGYRKLCIDEINRVTGISKNTINTWGPLFENCPEHVQYTLKLADTVNRVRELVEFPTQPSENN